MAPCGNDRPRIGQYKARHENRVFRQSNRAVFTLTWRGREPSILRCAALENRLSLSDDANFLVRAPDVLSFSLLRRASAPRSGWSRSSTGSRKFFAEPPGSRSPRACASVTATPSTFPDKGQVQVEADRRRCRQRCPAPAPCMPHRSPRATPSRRDWQSSFLPAAG